MGKTIWVIFILGFVAIVFVVLGMFLTLDQYAEVARVKLAASIRERFGFEEVAALVKKNRQKTVLHVSYSTRNILRTNPAAQDEEMALVGKHIEERYDERDVGEIDEFRVTRTEFRESRGRRQTFSREWVCPNPKKKSPYRIRGR